MADWMALATKLKDMVVGPSTSGEASSSQPSHGAQDGVYMPSPGDIVLVREMLSRSLQLPPDIVDAIFDHAEYWAHSTNHIDYLEEIKSQLRINGGNRRSEDRFLLRSFPIGLTSFNEEKNLSEELQYDQTEAKPLPLESEHDAKYFEKLATYPTPRLVHPVRKIVFTIKSKDQGWGGSREHKGTYAGSWTWFEAGLERFDASQACESQCPIDLRYNSPKSLASPLSLCALRSIKPPVIPDESEPGTYKYDHPLHHQKAWEIHRNKTATREWQNHVVTWSWRDDLDADMSEAQYLDNEGRGRATGDGKFVRSLKMGDVVTIWGKARFGGWVNNVEKVKIDIYWAV